MDPSFLLGPAPQMSEAKRNEVEEMMGPDDKLVKEVIGRIVEARSKAK